MVMRKNNIVNINVEKETINSQLVANEIGERHTETIRKIRTLVGYIETDAKLRSSDYFIQSSYKGGNGQQRPCYLLTRLGCEMYVNKLNGKKGTLFTAFYVKKFHEMDEELKLQNQDSYMIDDPVKRAEKWLEEHKRMDKLEKTNEKLQDKADAYDATLGDTSVMPIGELAKYIEQKLNANGYVAHIGRNNFFKYLRKHGYLIKSGAEYNLPTSSAMRLKLFKVVQIPIKKGGWIDTFKSVTRATAKSKTYFLNKAEEIVEMK
ncbi:Rha family transcriptional regulator [Apilactobacillus timberlakei]|uniref:Antirepressor protein C-terminal domain-containing protein n=1 Tax=Apilactobacillus timberlakei TaxID=2008380 RepID=A0ABY2YRD2_9LACO|nr:Rha family transcriptional regulator [Apilactobacillus timberlakei]TPR12774.1 hypothetical protein DY048_07120 [Apilactobacillus timberlakei]TPR13657.1 hypothetical protein DY052_07990 [Apilactobacillus timberlakei]